MKYFLLILFFSQLALAQSDPFREWKGDWVGQCDLSPAYSGVKSFKAAMSIAQAKAGNLKWQIIFEASGALPKQVRNYEMVPVDVKKGHYVIDEKNGLLLDTFLSGQALYAPFTINGNLITSTYTLISTKEMLFDTPMFDEMPLRETCVTGNASLCANSFALKSVQRCHFTKK